MKIQAYLLCVVPLFACSDSDSTDLAAACSTVCKKTAECSEGLISESQCVAQCKAGSSADSTDEGNCQPSQAQIDACLSAVESASCAALSGEALTACDFCPASSSRSDGGLGLGDASFGLGDLTSAGDCSDLTDCCTKLSGPDKQACDSTAAAATDPLCGALLLAYQQAKKC